MPVPVLIASMMRPEGETGVQTHVRSVRDWLTRNSRPVTLVTPFDRPQWQVYPVFGLRRLLDRVSKPASVWWYRHWHAVFLQRALSVRLADGKTCVIYAQCPLSARAALRARRVRVEVDASDDTLGNKIRKSQTSKVPYTLIVGGDEAEARTVAVRPYHGDQRKGVGLDAFVDEVATEIAERRTAAGG